MSNLLSSFIKQVLTEDHDKSHRCLNGEVVPVESIACFDDVCIRIEDATQTRNTYPLRSDSRSHYNGLLKVLRRKKRKAKKFMDSGA